ncbi:hypothetical protein T484DRAFT_1635432, partial [Baffinella frigidus]
PETRNPNSETRIPKPETRNPKPEFQNPKPETRIPKPETRPTSRGYVPLESARRFSTETPRWNPYRVLVARLPYGRQSVGV